MRIRRIHAATTLIFGALLHLVPVGNAYSGTEPTGTAHALWEKLETVHTGAALASIRARLEPAWQPVLTNHYLNRYPIYARLPYTNSAVVAEWLAQPEGSGQSSMLFFAIFSDARKTNLVDALLYCKGTVQPVVEGPYHKALHNIKKGDSVEKIFKYLGRAEFDYLKGEDGKWKVQLQYMGARGEFIMFEIDAGTGTVLRVMDMTI